MQKNQYFLNSLQRNFCNKMEFSRMIFPTGSLLYFGQGQTSVNFNR